jgi:hypothetical protein
MEGISPILKLSNVANNKTSHKGERCLLSDQNPINLTVNGIIEGRVRKLGEGAILKDLLDSYPNLERDDIR